MNPLVRGGPRLPQTPLQRRQPASARLTITPHRQSYSSLLHHAGSPGCGRPAQASPEVCIRSQGRNQSRRGPLHRFHPPLSTLAFLSLDLFRCLPLLSQMTPLSTVDLTRLETPHVLHLLPTRFPHSTHFRLGSGCSESEVTVGAGRGGISISCLVCTYRVPSNVERERRQPTQRRMDWLNGLNCCENRGYADGQQRGKGSEGPPVGIFCIPSESRSFCFAKDARQLSCGC